jgi:hypothetical protein
MSLPTTRSLDGGNWSYSGCCRWSGESYIPAEFGYSQRWGHWVLEGYAGVWFYTANNAFFDIPIPKPQTEAPVGSFEGHLSRDFTNRRFGSQSMATFGWVALRA